MSERVFGCSWVGRVAEWSQALQEGDQRRRQLYLSRDYRWATRQARISEFEHAWDQRTKQGRAANPKGKAPWTDTAMEKAELAALAELDGITEMAA